MTKTQQTPSGSSKFKIWLPLLLSLMMVAGMLIGMKMKRIPLIRSNQYVHTTSKNKVVAEGSKIEELLRYIENRYVDEIDREKLVDKAIRTILEELDPHSTYIDTDQLKGVNESMEGNFDGVGIEFLPVDDTILVVSAISGGPSDKAGILAGDKIITINDSIVAGVEAPISDMVKKLRGERGTTVKIGIKRRGVPELIHFDVERDEIPINSVDVAYMLNDETGYIKVNRFSATTHREFMDSLGYMIENEGMKDVVVDLRQNPGGYLQEATKMLSQLFDEKQQLLVYTEGRQVERTDYKSTGRPFYEVDEVVVLIDEGSASASEILAGAIQDWDRGTVVGRRSFGKGLVQEQYDLRDGSAIRLTVARYFTPTGRLIQKEYADGATYDDDLLYRMKSGELFSADSIELADTTKFYTLNEQRVVYGGGGITPDIFVPKDSLENDLNFLRIREYIPQFVFREMEKNEGTHKDYSLDNFVRQFQVNEKMLNDLVAFSQSKNEAISAEDLDEIKPLLKTQLKARFARHYFGDEGNFVVLNQTDGMVQEALNALKDGSGVISEKK